jgi:hypothetical protein
MGRAAAIDGAEMLIAAACLLPVFTEEAGPVCGLYEGHDFTPMERGDRARASSRLCRATVMHGFALRRQKTRAVTHRDGAQISR